jgi:hypothetical protein
LLLLLLRAGLLLLQQATLQPLQLHSNLNPR